MSIKQDSRTHDLLSLAKVLRKPFTVAEVMHVLGKFEKPSRVGESANVLIKHGFLVRLDDGKYQITSSGIAKLYDMTKYTSSSKVVW